MLIAVRGGPFVTATEGFTVEGRVGDGGFPIIVERLQRTFA
jgi:hypothetical protein